MPAPDSVLLGNSVYQLVALSVLICLPGVSCCGQTVSDCERYRRLTLLAWSML